MTEPPPPPDKPSGVTPPPPMDEGDGPPPLKLPGWVPALIGAVLVGMAALAVYTGLTYRATTLGRKMVSKVSRKFTQPREGVGVPGEPEPGASRVFHGAGGENAPVPGPDEPPGTPRVSVTGGKDGVTSTVRLSVSRGVRFKVKPEEALLYVNDQLIGPVKQFSDEDEAYDFPDEGTFTIRIEAPGYDDAVYVVSTDPESATAVALIETLLEPAKRLSQ